MTLILGRDLTLKTGAKVSMNKFKNSKRLAHRWVYVMAILVVSACVTPSKVTDNNKGRSALSADLKASHVSDGVEHFAFGDLSSSAWISDTFDGTKSRYFEGETLHFSVTQTTNEGGLDIGLSPRDKVPQTVIPAIRGLEVCSTYKIDLTGEGRWWAGPKISVNWQGNEAAKQNGDDWYENYIVEIASSTPSELHDIFVGDYFKAEELASTELAGSTYRHYKIRFHSWWQFWSVRQDYRATGTVPIAPIVEIWIANGLPIDRIFDGVKANIETYGPIEGKGQLRMQSWTNSSDAQSCE